MVVKLRGPNSLYNESLSIRQIILILRATTSRVQTNVKLYKDFKISF